KIETLARSARPRTSSGGEPECVGKSRRRRARGSLAGAEGTPRGGGRLVVGLGGARTQRYHRARPARRSAAHRSGGEGSATSLRAHGGDPRQACGARRGTGEV